MAKLTNTIIFGTSNVTGTSINTGNTFDISANGGIYLSGGNSVTSIVMTNAGSGYSTTPNITISNPTTTGLGGYPATANAFVGLWSLPIVNAGSGYANNDVISFNGGIVNGGNNQIVKLQVLSVNGTGAILTSQVYQSIYYGNYWTPPASPVSVTANTGVGVGATFSPTWVIFGIQLTSGGQGYTEPPVVSFNAPGSPTGLAQAYAVVGATTKVQSLSSNLDFYGANTNILRLMTYAPVGTQYPTNGNVPALAMLSPQSGFGTSSILSSSQLYFISATNAGGVGGFYFQTAASNPTITGSSGTSQFAVVHRDSSVNYLVVSGNTAGNPPTITPLGSDTNIDISLISKGYSNTNIVSANGTIATFISRTGGGSSTLNSPFIFKPGLAGTFGGALTLPVSTAIQGPDAGSLSITTNAGSSGNPGGYTQLTITNTSAVNYLSITGGTTGNGPTISTAGSDTNIALNLTPKGTGAVIANTTGGLYSNTAIYTNALYYANGVAWSTGGGGGSFNGGTITGALTVNNAINVANSTTTNTATVIYNATLNTLDFIFN